MANATAKAQLSTVRDEITHVKKQVETLTTKLAELTEIEAAIAPIAEPAEPGATTKGAV